MPAGCTLHVCRAAWAGAAWHACVRAEGEQHRSGSDKRPRLAGREASLTGRLRMCRQVVVQWTTRDVGSPVAQVGTTSGQYSQTALGVTTTYPRSLMVGPPANTVGYFDPVSTLLSRLTSAPSARACQLQSIQLKSSTRKSWQEHCHHEHSCWAP